MNEHPIMELSASADRSEADADLIRELADALEPLAQKFLYPEDVYEDGSWKDDEDLVQAQADNEITDDMWIKRCWVRRARAVVAKAKAAVGASGER